MSGEPSVPLSCSASHSRPSASSLDWDCFGSSRGNISNLQCRAVDPFPAKDLSEPGDCARLRGVNRPPSAAQCLCNLVAIEPRQAKLDNLSLILGQIGQQLDHRDPLLFLKH